MTRHTSRDGRASRRSPRRVMRGAGALFLAVGAMFVLLRTDYDEIREEG